MFIILYSVEFAGLAPLPTPIPDVRSDDSQKPLYVPLATLSGVTSQENIRSEFGSCLIPTFQRLVESEMHVILQEPSHHSITWGQHMAQLAALSRSRYCPGRLDGLPGIVDSRFVPFASWAGSARKMGGDFVELKRLQENFKRHDAGANRRLSTITKSAFSAAGGFLRQSGKALIIALDSILPTFLSEWIREAFSKGRG